MRPLLEKVIRVKPEDAENKNKYMDSVCAMLEKFYGRLGGHIKPRAEIENNNCVWKIHQKDETITAVVIYKLNGEGDKSMILCGCTPTSSGIKELYNLLKEDFDFTDRGSWGEYSDVVEKSLLKDGYAPVPCGIAEKVLAFAGKKMEEPDNDGFHYTRIVSGQPVRKIMFCNPDKQKEKKR